MQVYTACPNLRNVSDVDMDHEIPSSGTNDCAIRDDGSMDESPNTTEVSYYC